MKKKETLKVGFLFNWKYKRIKHLLPKEDFKKLLEVVGVTFPTRIVNNRCQGVDISLKVDENDNDISFKLKLFTEETFFHYYKKVLQTSGHVIQEETTFGKKQKGEDKKMNLKTERYLMKLNIQLQNEKETTKIYIKAPQYLSTMKANEVFLELENYKFGKTIPEIANYIEKMISQKVDLKQNEIEVKITKNGIDGSIEKATYLSKALQNVWKKKIEENAKIYSITRNRKGILERIQIINKRKFKGLLYHISIQKDIIDMEIRNDKENTNVLKILKRMSHEKFEDFQEEKNGTIYIKIYRRNMTPKLREFLQVEENLAIEVFNSEKISQ